MAIGEAKASGSRGEQYSVTRVERWMMNERRVIRSDLKDSISAASVSSCVISKRKLHRNDVSNTTRVGFSDLQMRTNENWTILKL